MKDNFNEYNVTCYVTVAVTVRGIYSATPQHAAMSAALAIQDELEAYDCRDLFRATSIEVEDMDHELTLECDGELDGFLVETEGKDEAVMLNENGEPI